MAQRDAAYWTAVSAVAAWCALALNALGLAFLWGQLRSNGKAIEAATESARAAMEAARIAAADVRPWVTIKVEPIARAYPTVGENKLRVVVKVALSNVGKNPAQNVKLTSSVVPNGQLDQLRSALIGSVPIGRGVTIFPRDAALTYAESLTIDRDKFWKVVLKAYYQIPGEIGFRETTEVFQIAGVTKKHNKYGERSPKGAILVQLYQGRTEDADSPVT